MSSATASPDDGLSAFLSVRPRLFGIAHRMLGRAMDAEDIVQDVWLRWQMVDRSVVRDAGAFLTTTATRLAINLMQSARSRRESYVGSWLTEPIDTRADPRLEAERGQALKGGVRLLLERLTPTERTAYILREAFDYSYRDIANVLRLKEANARQVVTRARKHVVDHRVTTERRVRSMPRRSEPLQIRHTPPPRLRKSNEKNGSLERLAVACSGALMARASTQPELSTHTGRC